MATKKKKEKRESLNDLCVYVIFLLLKDHLHKTENWCKTGI